MAITVFVAFLAVLSSLAPTKAQLEDYGENLTVPVTYGSRTLKGGEDICPPDSEREELQTVTDEEVASLLRGIVNEVAPCNDTNFGLEERCPAVSCKEIFERSRTYRPSGRYWINNTDGIVLPVVCDMTRECCGAVGGWTLVAYLDMTDSTQTCPDGWRTYNSGGKRVCGKDGSPTSYETVIFSTHRIEYSQVCGKIIGYQLGTTGAFGAYNSVSSLTIDGIYMDGISVTYGSPRQHIWSFVAAMGDGYTSGTQVCSCSNTANYQQISVPSYVGGNYFCEAGTYTSTAGTFYPHDPLWDGETCGPSSTCCYLNRPPWFCKQLPQLTSADIEVRSMTSNNDYSIEDVLIELIEIYIR